MHSMNKTMSAIYENLKSLSDKTLLTQTEALAREERRITVLVLKHLREIEVRRLFIDLGYSSMYEYCVKHLKYSEGQAQRRLSSARLLKELPEIEQKIKSGSINITSLTKVQSFLRTEKAASYTFNKSEKLELITKLENKSTREVEAELVNLSHQPALMAEMLHCSVPAEKLQSITHKKFDALLDENHQELLTEFKNLYAHELTGMSDTSVLVFMLNKLVHQKKKKLGLVEKQLAPETNAAPLPSSAKVILKTKVKYASLRKPIRASVKKAIWQRAQGYCEYRDPKTQQRCSSQFALQEDHIQPAALGGSNEMGNIQLLCRAHNSRRAVRTFWR